MTLYLVGNNVFYPLSDEYLVYVCKIWELNGLSIKEATDLINHKLLELKSNVWATEPQSNTVH